LSWQYSRDDGQLAWNDLHTRMVKTVEPDTSILGVLVMKFLAILPGEHWL
jgi:hypothetical protein